VSDVATAAVLGLIQGLTEFLPVSSTAHLVIAQQLFHLDPDRFGLAFDVAVHLGTALAVLLYFAGTWVSLAVDVITGKWRMPILIIVGTVPAAVAGVLFQSVVERELRDIRYIAAALLVGSLVFYVAERLASQRRDMEQLGLFDALFMGAAQAVALIPGISRSGITISAGLLAGVVRGDATRFSFLLATPVIVGAGAKTLLDARRAGELFAQPEIAAVGFAVSFVAGLAAVAFMVRFLRRNPLTWFIPYRVALALVLIGASLMGIA
jgi:undecaprenyl-diphosphatase